MLRALSFSLIAALMLTAMPAFAAGPAETDPAKAGPDFAVQGEYVGTWQIEGKEVKFGAQIIALGDGKFHGVAFPGGLPGEGATKQSRIEADGQRATDGTVVLKGPKGGSATITDGVITVKDPDGKPHGTLKKVVRTSPTQGVKPPAGAVVLFDGTSADKFEGGRMTPDGLLMEGATSKQKFQSFSIHIEFMCPFKPKARGQDRGNSGFYAQGRYEVQILDSFGLPTKDNECGGIYSVGAPELNMCYPPLSWQTYDIDFTAAEYKDGKKVKSAQLTVRHNGVEIHKGRVANHATTAAPLREGPEPGPVFLQNHGNPVRFRNIWVVEK